MRRPVRHRRDKRAADSGSVTLFVVALVPALLAMAGLVIDGGHALAARQEDTTDAEQAARAGADALSADSLRSAGPVRLDPAAAVAYARAYLSATGHNGTATAKGDTVTVTVRITRPTAVLSVIGIDTVSATATATATGITGIDRPEPTDSTRQATR
jgi:Flp pilus assembly protein TadG